MAQYDSTQAAKQADPTAKNLLDADAQQASTVYCEAEYVIPTAALAANDTVRLFKVPEGYRAIPHTFVVDTDGVGGTSAIISIGTASNPDSIASALDITAAGLEQALDSGDESLAPATSSTTEFLIATFTTLTATPTAGKKFVVKGLFAKA
jgi:hypothetical protein